MKKIFIIGLMMAFLAKSYAQEVVVFSESGEKHFTASTNTSVTYTFYGYAPKTTKVSFQAKMENSVFTVFGDPDMGLYVALDNGKGGWDWQEQPVWNARSAGLTKSYKSFTVVVPYNTVKVEFKTGLANGTLNRYIKDFKVYQSVDLSPAVSALDFGNVQLGETAEKTFQLGYVNLTALQASLDNGQFAAVLQNTQAGGSGNQTVKVTFTPQSSGRIQANLVLNNGVSKTITLSGVAFPATVVARYASDVTTSSFTANWDAVAGANSYTVRLYNDNGVVLRTETTDGTSFTFNRLGSTTTYGYTVVANGNDDTHSASESNTIWVGTATPVMVDAVIWTNATGDGLWATKANWKVSEEGVIRDWNTAVDVFGSALDVIIPSPENSKYLPDGITENATYGYAPSLSKGYGDVRLSNKKVATNIILEYGALFNVDEFAGTGVCDTIVTSMVVKGEDRGEWILAGATLQIFDETGMRPMQSGDFYLDKKPWVYMHELNVQNGENPVTSWGNAFASLTTELTPASAFAIKIENRYGKYGFPSERYYSKDSVMKYLGQQDVEYTFKGQPYTKLDYYTKADGWTVLTNIKLANIDVARLIAGIEGSQVAVWSFNDEKGNKGSWEVYSAANIGDKHPMIKPTYAFLYYNTKAVSADDLVNNYLNYSSSVKYHAATQSLDAPYARPELQVKVANGNYSSVTSVIYDDTLDEDELAAANTLKVFSGYEGTPDVCTSAGGKFYYAQTVNADVTEVPLTIKTTADMNVTMTFAGVAGFDAVRLKDKLTGALYDLNDDAAIEFELLEGDNADRFVLQFDYGMSMPTTDVAEQTEDAVWVSVNGRNVRIRSVYDIQKVSFVDMLGATRTLIAQGDDLTFDMSGYPAGVYVLVVTTENGTTTEKVLIK